MAADVCQNPADFTDFSALNPIYTASGPIMKQAMDTATIISFRIQNNPPPGLWESGPA
jgi:hypothetical protein